MLRGNRTSPGGQGPGFEKGKETGSGGGKKSREGGTKSSFGRPGKCLCPNCDYKWPRQPGKPCSGVICPQCGSQMMKE